MARSAKYDPIEKFRFRVRVISLDISATAALDISAAFAASASDGSARDASRFFSVLTRAGFSEIVLPRVSVNEMKYRENLDNARFIKVPGLATHDPVVLRRGVTDSRDLYNWYRVVNNDVLLLAAAKELTLDVGTPPLQSDNFRKEVIIEVLDREGNPVKQWMLFNAWPSGYKGGDDLSAESDTKLVEELTLSYEFFLELEGGIEGLLKELAKDAAENFSGYVLNKTIK
jgi:phage tail-like protein